MELIRKSVFETNSSSAHSLSIKSGKNAVYEDFSDFIVKGRIEIDCSDGIDFDYVDEATLETAIDKFTYLAMLCNSYPHYIQFDLDNLKNIVRRNTGCKDVLIYGISLKTSQLDEDTLDKLPDNESELYDLVFNPDVTLEFTTVPC